MGPQLDLLVDGGQGGDDDLTVRLLASRQALRLELVDHPHLHGQAGLGVVVHVHGSGVGLLALPVEPVDLILLTLVDVDGVFVDRGGGAEAVHLTDDSGFPSRGVDNHEVVPGCVAQADLLGRVGIRAPVIGVARLVQDTLFLEELENLRDGLVAVSLAFRKG